MKKKPAKGAGGKLVRSEIIQARLSPKHRFMAELMARAERRTLSSLIETLIEEAAQVYWVSRFEAGYEDARSCTLSEAVEHIWHTEEPIRLISLALAMPGLLMHEEEKIWYLIYDTPYFWQCRKVSLCDEQGREIETKWQPLYSLDGLIKPHLYAYWEDLKAGKLSRQDLPPANKVGKKLMASNGTPLQKKAAVFDPTVGLHHTTAEQREAWLDEAMEKIERYGTMQDRKKSIHLTREYMQGLLDHLIQQAKEAEHGT